MSGLYTDNTEYTSYNSKFRVYVSAYNSNKEYLGSSASFSSSDKLLDKNMFTVGTPAGEGDIAYLRATYETTSGNYIATHIMTGILNIQLEAGSSATKYESFIRRWSFI